MTIDGSGRVEVPAADALTPSRVNARVSAGHFAEAICVVTQGEGGIPS